MLCEHLALLNLPEGHKGPPLQPARVPVGDILSIQHVSHTTQLRVVGKLAEGAPNPIAHVADEDVQEHQFQHWPQGMPLITGFYLDIGSPLWFVF